MKTTVKTIRSMKNKEKITMLTAYDYPTAKIVDEAGCDMILVGDSLGNVVLGYENTTHVTLEDMLHHTKAVARGAKNPLIVADMPFLSCHLGVYKAVENAGRLISEGNAEAVKIEGGREVAEAVKAICAAGIPVMGHLGLTPQSVNQFGGFGVRAKEEAEALRLIEDAHIIEEAGAFAITLECIPHDLAKKVTSQLSIPTIGIGAGGGCDGQVLVIHDMLGLSGGHVPSFVKKYADLAADAEAGIRKYIDEVKEGVFPQ